MNSHSQLNKITLFRQFVLKEISGLSIEQLNAIPSGFNNNIIWNLGHILAATQAICYRRAGQPVVIDEQYFLPFLTNTKPGNSIGQEDAHIICELLESTVAILQHDYDRRHFSNYTMSENIQAIYGIELRTIDDAIDFLLYHDGYHAAKINMIKQLV
jgi:hypothetical protein